MTFSFPLVLWALLALAIPIIVHLFHFKRHKKVLFTNVSLLKQVIVQKSSRNRLRELLILLSRLLALAALILAFAYPLLTRNNQSNFGQNNVSIFLDNSFSMQSNNEGVRLLDIAKSKAREVIGTFGDADKFQIISHQHGIRPIQWFNKSDALESIDQVDIDAAPYSLDEASELIKRLDKKEGNVGRFAYFISDFQRTAEQATISMDTSIALTLIPIRSKEDKNTSIDSAWFESPIPTTNRPNLLQVKYHNHSKGQATESRASISVNGNSQPLGSVKLEPGESRIDSVYVEFDQTGWQKIILSIADHPIVFDDNYHLTFEVLENLRILIVHDKFRKNNPSIDFNKAFSSVAHVQVDRVDIGKINYSSFGSYQLVILDELSELSTGLIDELSKACSAGTNIYLVPNAKMDMTSHNAFLKKWESPRFTGSILSSVKSIGKINSRSEIFKDVYEKSKRLTNYPTTKGNFEISSYGTRPEFLINYQNNTPFLLKYPLNAGNLFLQTAPNASEWSNLNHYIEIWIPLIYNMGLSKNSFDDFSFTIGKPSTFQLSSGSPSDDHVYQISGSQSFIPEQRQIGSQVKIRVDDQIEADGFYEVLQNKEVVRYIAFNYSREESAQDVFSDETLSSVYPDAKIISGNENINIASILKLDQFGLPLWRYLIVLALVFLLAESLLIRIK